MVDDRNASDGAFRVHAHHHFNAALGAGGGDLYGIAGGLAVHLDLVHLVQGAAGSCGRSGHIARQFQRVGEGGVVRIGHHGQHGRFSLLLVDLSDGAGRHTVDQTQQQCHDQAGPQQGHSQLYDVLGVHINLFFGLDFVAHFAAASLLADFTTPKREGFTALSISATTRFIIMME